MNYSGIEHHRQCSHITWLDEEGVVVKSGRVANLRREVERTVRAIRWRSRVIGVFPTVDSYVRLVTCYLVEYSED